MYPKILFIKCIDTRLSKIIYDANVNAAAVSVVLVWLVIHHSDKSPEIMAAIVSLMLIFGSDTISAPAINVPRLNNANAKRIIDPGKLQP